jgi:hypothetical protein
MRDFIKDAFLLRVLDEIEAWLGCEIVSMPLPSDMHSTHAAAVGMCPDGTWCFSHNPGDPPSNFTLCHELMHVVLGIEGWPFWKPTELFVESEREKLLNAAINFPQHVVINSRMNQMGHIEPDQQWPEDGSSADRVQDQPAPQPIRLPLLDLRVKTQAILVAERLLSPTGFFANRVCRNVLQQDFPHILSLADAICEDVAMHQPLDRQSSASLLQSVLEKVSEPKGILKPLPSGKKYYLHFFDDMIAKLASA